jgi:uncharacterized protein (DUF433 family)
MRQVTQDLPSTSAVSLTTQFERLGKFRGFIMFDRIVCDPEILGGKPTIKGTRISVEIVLEWLASGSTAEKIVAEYDHLAVEDIQQSLRYAAACMHDKVVLHTKVAS